jgi:FkbM family methyltransferase
MTEFIFNEAFRGELRESAHHYGEVAFLESVLRPGMTVVEGGANRGVTAIAIAKTVGKTGCVHAFEPVPEYFKALQQNVSRNRIRNMRLYNLALSDRNGSIRFYQHGEGSGITRAAEAEKIEVKATTLPRFLVEYNISTLDFINCDCEGSELLVFRKARKVLKMRRPLIFCEVHRNYLKALKQSVMGIVRFLQALGYTVKPVQVEALNSDSDFDRCSHIFASMNLFEPTGKGRKRKESK